MTKCDLYIICYNVMKDLFYELSLTRCKSLAQNWLDDKHSYVDERRGVSFDFVGDNLVYAHKHGTKYELNVDTTDITRLCQSLLKDDDEV